MFDEVGVRFAHEVHPSEIAYDFWTTARALEAVGHRPAFGLNFDPSHFIWQDLDPVGVPGRDFADRDLSRRLQGVGATSLDGRNGRLSLAPALG